MVQIEKKSGTGMFRECFATKAGVSILEKGGKQDMIIKFLLFFFAFFPAFFSSLNDMFWAE